MPGALGARSVPGAGGFGKVELKFVPRKNRRQTRGFIGVLLFSIGAFFLVFRTLWNMENMRRDLVAPALRSAVKSVDYLRYSFLRMVSSNQRPSHRYFTPRDIMFGSTNAETSPEKLSDLQHTVKVSSDGSTGYTNINAETLRDAVFTQGYVHSGEKWHALDIRRRTAIGTVAAVLGATYVASDKTYRTLGIRRRAVEDWERLLADTQSTGSKASAAAEQFACPGELDGNHVTEPAVELQPITNTRVTSRSGAGTSRV